MPKSPTLGLLGASLFLAGCSQTLQSADLVVLKDTSVTYSLVYSSSLPSSSGTEEETQEVLDAEIQKQQKKFEPLSRACDVSIIPYVQQRGIERAINLKFKGKVERYYGIQRLFSCVGSDKSASLEIRRRARLMSIEYQFKMNFEVGDMEKVAKKKISTIPQLPESISIDVPGKIDPDSVINKSKGLSLSYIWESVGDSVLEIRPKIIVKEAELNAQCSEVNQFCAKRRTEGDVVDISFSSFDPRYDLPGLIGIGAGISGIAAGVLGSGIFGMFRRKQRRKPALSAK